MATKLTTATPWTATTTGPTEAAAAALYAPATSAPAKPPVNLNPGNRAYVFAKNCTNNHGSFAKGDKARGAFAPELVASYLAAGILVAQQQPV